VFMQAGTEDGQETWRTSDDEAWSTSQVQDVQVRSGERPELDED